MSWRSRHKKSFIRRIEQLKNSKIVKIDSYLLVVCENPYKDEATYINSVISSYKERTENKSIKTYLNFDSYFNPNLNLAIGFEDNPEKKKLIITKALDDIGGGWAASLESKFPNSPHTIIRYYNKRDEEWFLDFYNGPIDIEAMRRDEYCSDLSLISAR